MTPQQELTQEIYSLTGILHNTPIILGNEELNVALIQYARKRLGEILNLKPAADSSTFELSKLLLLTFLAMSRLTEEHEIYARIQTRGLRSSHC
jgi:hypothetical protein